MNRTVFIAGASGAIGRWLCRLLVDEGWSVSGTTRSLNKAPMLHDLGVELVVVDVFDAALLLEIVCKAKPEIVVHQLTDLPPALAPAKMAEALVRNARLREIGTRNLVAAAVAAGVQRMVAQSLAFVYAPGPMPYREAAPLMLDDPGYGETARAVASLEQQVLAPPWNFSANLIRPQAFQQQFPLAVIVLDQPDCIWIVAVMHMKRCPGYWRERLGS